MTDSKAPRNEQGGEKELCYKALACLYIAVDSKIADDVNDKVKAYIKILEQK